jgi:hypothetical protein
VNYLADWDLDKTFTHNPRLDTIHQELVKLILAALVISESFESRLLKAGRLFKLKRTLEKDLQCFKNCLTDAG